MFYICNIDNTYKRLCKVKNMMLITGVAGFIGFFAARELLEQGEQVIGLDCLTDYYDIKLKHARLEVLKSFKNFKFEKLDISDFESLSELSSKYGNFDKILHLAAQAGVRYSIEAPFQYAKSNLYGHLSMLELARAQQNLNHFVYASSSSVYGGNVKQPFSEMDKVDLPLSIYAATKRSDELMTQSYSHLFNIPATGLRFFTVYGPWGRPDMACFSFTKDILEGLPITINNHGDMKRDFTWIDDCVAGVLSALETPPQVNGRYCIGDAPHRVVNLGNNKPEKLLYFIELIENSLGKTTEKIMGGMAPGDVKETFANIDIAKELYGYNPSTSLEIGIPKFVEWYLDFYGHKAAA
jgi:UDP-glucuronate 4-epimerase